MGEAAGSALIDSLNGSTHFLSAAAQLLQLYHQASNSQFLNTQKVYTVIPGFDTKLGLTYQHEFTRGLFKLSAGYQAAIYFNAITQYLPQTLVNNNPLESGGIFVATVKHNISNYSVQGPFLNLSFQA